MCSEWTARTKRSLTCSTESSLRARAVGTSESEGNVRGGCTPTLLTLTFLMTQTPRRARSRVKRAKEQEKLALRLPDWWARHLVTSGLRGNVRAPLAPSPPPAQTRVHTRMPLTRGTREPKPRRTSKTGSRSTSDPWRRGWTAARHPHQRARTGIRKCMWHMVRFGIEGEACMFVLHVM
jgi:hypothetical protein